MLATMVFFAGSVFGWIIGAMMATAIASRRYQRKLAEVAGWNQALLRSLEKSGAPHR